MYAQECYFGKHSLRRRTFINQIDTIQRIGCLRELHLHIGVPQFHLISVDAHGDKRKYRMILRLHQIITLQFQKIIESIKVQTTFMTELRLVYVGINDQAVHIIEKAAWRFIKIAKLSKNMITWKGIKHLAKCKWQYLNLLQLCKNPIKNKGVQALCKTEWPNLRYLHLSACGLDDNSIKVLRKGILDKLHYINLSENFFTHNCLKLLATANIKHLEKIDLKTDDYTEDLLKVFYFYIYKMPFTDEKYQKKPGLQYSCSYYTKSLQQMFGSLFK